MQARSISLRSCGRSGRTSPARVVSSSTGTASCSRLRRIAGVPSDILLHSLRHFQSTVLDPIVSEAQKQARLGWATVHMARHYTDAITEEDRKAASHVGVLL